MMLALIDKKLLKFRNKFTELQIKINNISPVNIEGKVLGLVGNIIEAALLNAKLEDFCIIQDGDYITYAEVISIEENKVKLLPYNGAFHISQNAWVSKVKNQFAIKVGQFMLGKIVNSMGNILGSLAQDTQINEEPNSSCYLTLKAKAPDPLKRPIITKQILTGVKSIDLFMSCGCGQRLAIFASPGMGKTTLMGMILRNSNADVIVVALIGERGREVQEFIELEINQEVSKKIILVFATSDESPAELVKAAFVSQTIAEYFRDQGKNVLLFMDSITRFARAQREIGLASGEKIARGGFPASVFLAFPKLIERAGNNELGTITAFYTVLMQNENITEDPIADEIKSIVDGHIMLCRKLVEQSHYPACDILTSLSRVADRVITAEHLQAARKIRMLIAKHNELEFLVRVGEYQPGNDLVADEAINKYQDIMQFLQQGIQEQVDFKEALNQLKLLANR